MNAKIIAAIVALGALLPMACAAAPMRCSDEQKVCVAACGRGLDPAAVTTCITNCRGRQAACMQTGCWNTGTTRYCNMMRQ